MENRNIQNQNENGERSKAKAFWKTVGLIAIALTLSVLTVVVMNLNR